jgi:rhodanese-related sulfurtransferase
MNATLFLRERGLKQVWSLAGGIDLWSSQIDPEVPRY